MLVRFVRNWGRFFPIRNPDPLAAMEATASALTCHLLFQA